MDQPSLFEESNETRAEMSIHLSWNNGPFDSSHVHLRCQVGTREVFSYWTSTNDQEMDFSEVMHVAAREAQRLVLGHRVTNSHIRRGRVVYSALSDRSFDLDEKLDASGSSHSE